MKRIAFVVVIIAWIIQGCILAYAAFYNFSALPYNPLWIQILALLSCAIVLIAWIASLVKRCRSVATKWLNRVKPATNE